MSALYNLLSIPYTNYLTNYLTIDEEEEDLIAPLTIALRRTFACKCKLCNSYYSDILVNDISSQFEQGKGGICWLCSQSILRKCKQFQTNLITKVRIKQVFHSKIHQEIIELAFQPNRIRQTELWNYQNWNFDN